MVKIILNHATINDGDASNAGLWIILLWLKFGMPFSCALSVVHFGIVNVQSFLVLQASEDGEENSYSVF